MLLAEENNYVMLISGGVEDGCGCLFPDRSEPIHYDVVFLQFGLESRG